MGNGNSVTVPSVFAFLASIASNTGVAGAIDVPANLAGSLFSSGGAEPGAGAILASFANDSLSSRADGVDSKTSGSPASGASSTVGPIIMRHHVVSEMDDRDLRITGERSASESRGSPVNVGQPQPFASSKVGNITATLAFRASSDGGS